MKKSILLFFTVLIALSLTAFGVINWNDLETEKAESSASKELAIKTTTEEKGNPNSNYEGPIGPILKSDTVKVKPKVFEDFIYDVGPRFEPFKKSNLRKAKSIEYFFEWEELQTITKLSFVEIIIIENDRQTQKREIGYTNMFTEAQLKLIQSFDYNSHFNIRMEYQKKNTSGQLEHKFNSPHLTIVPEKQAVYSDGYDALKKFLKESSREARIKANVDPMKLQPAKLIFTVTKNGNIENIRLDRTSKYPLVDKTMIELISKTPGTWKPAENEKGEKMDQELVVSFGLMGC